MATLILDTEMEQKLIADRAHSGADLYDEVWDNTYIMSPLANNEHQRLLVRLTVALDEVVGNAKLGVVYAGCNVSDQANDWKGNFRIPDLAVFLNGTAAIDRGAYWFGGPDLAIEIVSPGDRSREKFDFYSKVATREVLIIDRDPWQLELYRLDSGSHRKVASQQPGDLQVIVSEVVGMSFGLEKSEHETVRPVLKMIQLGSGMSWTF